MLLISCINIAKKVKFKHRSYTRIAKMQKNTWNIFPVASLCGFLLLCFTTTPICCMPASTTRTATAIGTGETGQLNESPIPSYPTLFLKFLKFLQSDAKLMGAVNNNNNNNKSNNNIKNNKNINWKTKQKNLKSNRALDIGRYENLVKMILKKQIDSGKEQPHPPGLWGKRENLQENDALNQAEESSLYDINLTAVLMEILKPKVKYIPSGFGQDDVASSAESTGSNDAADDKDEYRMTSKASMPDTNWQKLVNSYLSSRGVDLDHYYDKLEEFQRHL